MKRNRFTPTTGILIAVLVGALYMVGKQVTPPPPAPPKAPDPPKTTPAEQATNRPDIQQMNAKQMADRMKQEEMMAKRMELRKKLMLEANGGKPLPPDDGITSAYFADHTMGAKGQKQADDDAANSKRVNDYADKQLSKLMPDSNHGKVGVPSLAPPAAPRSMDPPTP